MKKSKKDLDPEVKVQLERFKKNLKPGGNIFLLCCLLFAGFIMLITGNFFLLTGIAGKAEKGRAKSSDNCGIMP